jgi:hypothetical protein
MAQLEKARVPVFHPMQPVSWPMGLGKALHLRQ